MGFKCRLFGHTYGNPEVERTREEEGDEVVVTIRNVKRCERCGDERMVNQTKEVTSVRTPEEVGLDDDKDAPGTTESAGEPPNHGSARGESPVEPAPAAEPTPDPDNSVDATVGVDAEPAGDVGEGATADTAGDGVAAQPGSGDGPGSSEGRDDAAAGEPDGRPVGTAGEPDAEAGEAVSDPSATEGPDSGWETGSDDWGDVDPDPDVDDAVILDAGETERDEVQWPEESDADPEADTDTAHPEASRAEDPPTNDAEIIDGEAGVDPSRGSAGGWPEHEGADEGYSAAPNGDVDAEFGGNGLTPEVNGGAPDDSAAVDGITVGGGTAGRAGADTDTDTDTDADAGTGSDAGTGEGFVRAGESTTEDVPSDRVEFYCPNCGHARTAGASSIRAGDICPECKQGYIAERER